jgi:hypothetical protein
MCVYVCVLAFANRESEAIAQFTHAVGREQVQICDPQQLVRLAHHLASNN